MSRHATTVAIDEQTSERISALAERLKIAKLDVVRRAIEILARAHDLPNPQERASARASTTYGGKAEIDRTLIAQKVGEFIEHLGGNHPSQAAWDSWSEAPCNSKVVAKAFGGGRWTDAMVSFGVARKDGRGSRRRYTDEQLIEMLRTWVRIRGESPTQAEWTAAHPGGPNEKLFSNRWGTWNKALAAAGLPYRSKGTTPRAAGFGRNRQMVTGGKQDQKPIPWNPDAEIETIR